MKTQRILAVIGLILMVVSIVTMIGGMFAGAAKPLISSVSLVCFLGAAAILLALSAKRKAADDSEPQDKAE